MLRAIKRRIKEVGSTLVRGVRAAGRALGWTILGGGSRFRNDAELLALLGTNARLGSPADAIATDVSMVPWVLKKRTRKKGVLVWEEVGRLGDGAMPTDDPVLKFLRNPTARLTWSAWIYVLTIFRLVVGYAPIWAQADDKGNPAALQPVAPQNVMDRRPVMQAGGEWVWRIVDDGITKPVELLDLLWAFRVDPLDPKGPGLGKARGVEGEIAADEAMSKFQSMYFENGAVLGPVVNVPGADLDLLTKEWQQERKGVINAHRPLLTNSEQAPTVSNTAPSIREMAMPEGRKLGRDFILQAFHVSQVRVGVLENSSRAIVEGSDFHQQKHCTLPELVYWREFFNSFVIPRLGDDYYLDFVNPVKETAEFRRQLGDTGVKGGWIMINEARQMHDLPPIPGGEMLLIPVNNVIMLDVSDGIKVPDITTQLRLFAGARDGAPPDKPKKSADDELLATIKALLQQVSEGDSQ